MRGRCCTIDSSCVLALDCLDLLPSLSVLFSKVLIPKAVRTELFRRRRTKDRLRRLFANYAFLRQCNEYDQGAADFLLAERALLGLKDRGEVEAVVQAAQVGASVLVDDAWGRKLAKRDGLDCHGTVWVLLRLHETRLLQTSLHDCFAALQNRNIRLKWSAINELLQRLGEAPLPPATR